MNHFFGQNLKTIRIERKLSQAELGAQLNKGQKTIGNWETGYSEPCIEDLLRISHFFGIAIDTLIRTEILREKFGAKAGRNRHKENDSQADVFAPAPNSIKRVSQDGAEDADATDDKEIAWRDKYIAVLETRLSETASVTASEETLKNLLTRILSLQKTIERFTIQ